LLLTNAKPSRRKEITAPEGQRFKQTSLQSTFEKYIKKWTSIMQQKRYWHGERSANIQLLVFIL